MHFADFMVNLIDYKFNILNNLLALGHEFAYRYGQKAGTTMVVSAFLVLTILFVVCVCVTLCQCGAQYVTKTCATV